ncbi:helix-turn-helix transcriptional regulator [Desulfofundulus kuznetsovii]|uniref:helix-turn-helix transcriptional regulator n=1 Tax=Desulfofundulus kuznetsovii TaxID=58135 RepID=UPI0003114670
MKEVDAKTFGARLRYLRKERKLSQQELGQMIGKPQTTISDWENGKFLPDIDEAVEIAKAFGLTISEFLYSEDLPPAACK